MDYRKRIKELREILEYNSKLYYDMDAPVMPDYEYDKLLRELEQLKKQSVQADTEAVEAARKAAIDEMTEKVDKAKAAKKAAAAKAKKVVAAKVEEAKVEEAKVEAKVE